MTAHKLAGQGSPLTKEERQSIASWWDQGVSTAEIGRRLGRSKNSVIGHAHRLGLKRRASPIKYRHGTPQTASVAELQFDSDDAQPLPPGVDGEQRRWPNSTLTISQEVAALKMVNKGVSLSATGRAFGVSKEVILRLRAAAGKAKTPSAALPLMTRVVTSVIPPKPQRASGKPPVQAAPRRVHVVPRDLRTTSCCWPIGEPGQRGFRFCDAPPVGNRPYCVAHCKMAYVGQGHSDEMVSA